ncbi:MAG: ABC transporter ATP-binding protein [Anaerolineales bacterium]|nr:ABC transporter ATP-binding protein [Anaerolineales bacterium]
METAIRVDNLIKVFTNDQGELDVLQDLSFSIASQEFVCLIGPSGCGKTTLLRVLAGLLPPSDGEVFYPGRQTQNNIYRVGFVFQNANLMPWRTVIENVLLPLELEYRSSADNRRRAVSMLELVGLAGFEKTYPGDLSGGMAQRVAIARALINEPEVLYLDEPFGALDALTRERMGSELIRIWQAKPVTVVMVTHSISEAILLSDRVLVLSKRPAQLKLDLPISFPRPRTLDLKHTKTFGSLAGEIRRAIQV